jgi:hypothetical protein
MKVDLQKVLELAFYEWRKGECDSYIKPFKMSKHVCGGTDKYLDCLLLNCPKIAKIANLYGIDLEQDIEEI